MKHHTGRQIHLKIRPEGVPRKEDFGLAEVEIDEPESGQFLVRNEWLSVDPYMRGRMSERRSYVEPFRLGEPMEGGCVGKVIASRNDSFKEGDYVLGNQGWRDLWLSDGEGVIKVDPEMASPRSFLSVLGLTGMTAYVGLMKIAQLKDGEQVFVSAASGAVGSIVCQIAKLHGCRVVGSSGSEKKIDWLKTKAGVGDAFNYHKTEDISARLRELLPKGIDVYFDNVGGDHLEGAIDQMNDFGRIACCGMISGYNSKSPAPGPSNLFKIIGKRIRMQGFIVRDHQDMREEFQQRMTEWIEAGRIVWEETITEGLEKAPDAFIALFSGEKMGKALVKVT